MTHMGQNKISVEWVFVSDDEWVLLTAETVPQAPAPIKGTRLSWLWKYVVGCIPVMACSALVLFMLLEREAERAIAQVQSEIQGVIAAESKAWYASNEAMVRDLLDDSAPMEWALALRRAQYRQRFYAGLAAREPVATVQQIELRGEYVLADVLVTQSELAWLPAPYREMRFYRETEVGWRRTAPQVEFWGPRTELRTDHFVFRFHRRDRIAVMGAAPTLQARYLSLRQELALPAPSADAPLVIEIIVATAPDWDILLSAKPNMHCIIPLIDSDLAREQAEWCLNSNRTRANESVLVLPSPALLPMPQEVDGAATLTAMTGYQLASLLLDEKIQQAPISAQWMTFLEGLRLALAWSPTLPKPSWFHEGEALFCRRAVHGPPLQLSDIEALTSDRPDSLGIFAAHTVVEYAIQAHGRQALPDLIEGLSQHMSWQTLLPDVVGTNAIEFERGWQASIKHCPKPLESMKNNVVYSLDTREI